MQNFPDEIESTPTYDMQFSESVNSNYEIMEIKCVAGKAHGCHEQHSKWNDVLLGLARFDTKQDLLKNPNSIFDEELSKENPEGKDGFYFCGIHNKIYLDQEVHRFKSGINLIMQRQLQILENTMQNDLKNIPGRGK